MEHKFPPEASPMLTKGFKKDPCRFMMKYPQLCPKIAEHVKKSKDMSKIGTQIPAGGKSNAH